MAFETVSSEKIYHGRVFDLRRDQVRMPDGRLVALDVVDHPGAITVIPLDDQGQIWFVRQYRHPTESFLLELPAGVKEPGEQPELTAQREIQEEIGMAATEIRKVGEFFLAPGYSTEYMHVYLASGLYQARLQGDEDEYLSVEKVPLEKAYRLAEAGEIRDAKSLAALLLARPSFYF
jgi:ADP-ribose pyrophosphatase